MGIEEDVDVFDDELIMHINSALMVLTQLGIGPKQGFLIEDDSYTWEDFIGSQEDLEAVKSYVALRVRLSFDPPSSSFVLESINRTVTELGWRLNVQVDSGGDYDV